MKMIIYGDFNCPYCYLASQRSDMLIRSGTAEIDWRAVEHDRGLPVTGTRSDASRAEWGRELADVAALALPGERPPAAPPAVVSNTRAAVAAYAEAVTDGVQDGLRHRLFGAIWVDGRHMSSAYDVRRLITEVMWPAEPIFARLRSPELPSALIHDPDLARIVRRSGGTIAPDGGPLTMAGYQRIRHWRQEWLALPRQLIPAVIGPDGTLYSGVDGLRYLAGLVSLASVAGRATPGLAGRSAAAAARDDRKHQVAALAS